ncbi:DUF924 family protein [Nitratireductor thuwali]|uniref:DUF924 domain-containing protein n=1 Tax=Nitratireductor thuwali TaxID=2267699 RepID=A0ABY5MMG8_9HYPH|nr:hypothetical protein NTH_02505 [Nitratireductor thuwali]
MDDSWVDEVLAFWFEELEPKDWFEGSDALDDTIRTRFGALHERLAGGQVPPEVMEEPRTALAAVIVLDQFSRNIHRRSARAFAADDMALRIARNAVDKKFDDDMTPEERQFLYMPFQHSEISADQEHSVMLFKSLGDEEAIKYAVEHRDIIEKFGRFPHRNRALGRESTREEIAFLEGHVGFGQ